MDQHISERNFFWPKICFDSKKIQTTIFFDPKRSSLVFWYKPTKPKCLEPKTFQAEHFRPKSCFQLIFWPQTLVEKEFLGPTVFLNQNIVWTENYLDQNFVWTKYLYLPDIILLNSNINATTKQIQLTWVLTQLKST